MSQLTIHTLQHIKISFDEFKKYNLSEKYKNYQDLYNENVMLRNQINNLIINNTMTTTENFELKNKINMLTKQIDDQHILLTEIDKLKKENNELRHIIENQNLKIDELKEENKQSKKEID
jgi:predicted RNase H-like nuclease (RuvC/YqgF family)